MAGPLVPDPGPAQPMNEPVRQCQSEGPFESGIWVPKGLQI